MNEYRKSLQYEEKRARELKKEAGDMVNEQIQRKAKGIKKAL